MCAMKNNKRNSLPSLTMNKFFVNKRASMFETVEEKPRDKREWSPCGVVETSQRKMEARKEEKRKERVKAKLKRQADPYAEESSGVDDDEFIPDTKACGHANKAVCFQLVRKTLKQGQGIGICTHCNKGHKSDNNEVSNSAPDGYDPVIWMCVYCGHQGCDRNTKERHALLHYRTPRTDPHCVILNTQVWNVWCYECDSEINQKSSKKLHDIVEYVKRQKDMAPKRESPPRPIPNNSKPTYSSAASNLVAKFSSSDKSNNAKNQVNSQANTNATLPKVKGISNLGNTCFFNSVMQSLGQTHFLTQLLDVQCQSGQRISLPGNIRPNTDDDELNGKIKKKKNSIYENENEDDEEMELYPLDLMLPEGGALTMATAVFLKDMHAVGKTNILNPTHLFGQVTKKSMQFQGYEQQDAHELLRCLLDAIRNEEILRSKRAILKAFCLSEKTDPNTVNSRLKKMIKGYGRQATHTIVDHIFGGHLISTVFCEECHWSSQVFEPFMDLSLPINEERGGKPKKGSSFDEDDSVFDCFGRTNSSSHLSKQHLKKQKKENNKSSSRKGRTKGGGLAPPCIRANPEDKDDHQAKLDRRRTEKSRPEDKEEYVVSIEEKLVNSKIGISRGESFKFKQLMAARRKTRRVQQSEDEESDSGTESEGDDDDDDCSLQNGVNKKNDNNKDKDDTNSSDEEDEDDSDEEDDSDDSDDDDESDKTKKEMLNGTNKKNCSSEISDADIEDNTDSEQKRHNYHNTRQPSIVVEQSENDTNTCNETGPSTFKYLNSCHSSFDQLNNYNSASETSERYYTPYERDCNGIDTCDDFENYHDTQALPVDQSHMEEMCLKVGELKIRRKSSSKECLLDTQKFSQKRGSTETLHHFKEKSSDGDDENKKRARYMKKLKQEWIARSLTTLAPRYQCRTHECSVMSCLTSFTAPELLTGNNKITCENCTKIHNQLRPDNPQESIKSNASKQLLILSPPAVLTLQLKRFHHSGFNVNKVNRYVHFPLVLDIAPFTSSISLGLGNMSKDQNQVLYGLYGVVEHSGRLNSGHYAAYVRSRPLDPNKTSKQYLNLKPSSQFEINQLVEEMAEKIDSATTTPRLESKTFAGGIGTNTNKEEFETEIKKGRWYHVSDTYVAEVSIEKVMKAQAYLLFYERLL